MTLEDKSEALNAISQAIRRTGVNRAQLTLSNGIVIEFRPVTPTLLTAVRADLESKYPSAPTTFIEAKGRDEPNPNDAAYQDQLRRAVNRTEAVLSDLVVAASCEIISVPDGYHALESDDWLTDPRITAAVASGLIFDPADAIKRKVVWLQFYAVETWADDRLFQSMPASVAGVSEREVQNALDSFRGLPVGGTDTPGAAASPGTNGDRGNRSARRRRP